VGAVFSGSAGFALGSDVDVCGVFHGDLVGGLEPTVRAALAAPVASTGIAPLTLATVVD
jgi:hypothetical protein